MIDFIEYVVAELKSKRLSKTDAVSLVRQFSQRPSGGGAAIHPLLQRNTSDLDEQRYQSTFTGAEFFLADHQVGGHKVLPGVAYLEMARAAMVDAMPQWPDDAVLELRNVAWAQPVVVDEKTDVNLALIPAEDDEIDFEVFSGDTVHCQGRVVLRTQARPEPIALLHSEHVIDAASVYSAYAQMGLAYGPSFQGITSIQRGANQVLAKVRVGDVDPYVLHPSVMDCATLAAIGLLDDLASLASEPRLPFAIDVVRVFAPCTREMYASVRSIANAKADIDLCDEHGNVCVQMHGFTWRTLKKEQSAPAVEITTQNVVVDTAAQEFLPKQLASVLQAPPEPLDPAGGLEK